MTDADTDILLRRESPETTQTALTVAPVSGALGAEVRGVKLATLTDEMWDELQRLWREYLVLFFPDQYLTPDQHVAFARRLGVLEIHPFSIKLDQDHPEVVVGDSESGGKADRYHTDVTFSPTPPMASILSMDMLPPFGGDTIWTNQYLAYDALAPATRAFIDELSAVHDGTYFGHSEIEATHPVVRIHPDTCRKSLFVNRTFTRRISELGPRESDAILALLFDVSEQPFLQCRYRWREGTVALWDNRVTQHYAVNDYSERRRFYRVTVIGDVPQGPERRWEAVDVTRSAASSLDQRANSIDPPLRS